MRGLLVPHVGRVGAAPGWSTPPGCRFERRPRPLSLRRGLCWTALAGGGSQGKGAQGRAVAASIPHWAVFLGDALPGGRRPYAECSLVRTLSCDVRAARPPRSAGSEGASGVPGARGSAPIGPQGVGQTPHPGARVRVLDPGGAPAPPAARCAVELRGGGYAVEHDLTSQFRHRTIRILAGL